MSFSEVRDYQFGDDVRNIEWNVTARTGTPHVKVFEEERELTVMMLVDVSPSSTFGTKMHFRKDLITEICAVLSFSAINNNDKVGLVMFSDEVQLFIPPKKGKKHILRIIRELIDQKPIGQSTNIETALRYFNNVVKKKSICFLLSDFYAGSFSQALQVVARKHDLIVMHIYDSFEKELPKAGLVRMQDSETGRMVLVDTNDRRIRSQHAQHFVTKQEDLTNLFAKSGADIINLDTRESYIVALHRFFKKRAK